MNKTYLQLVELLNTACRNSYNEVDHDFLPGVTVEKEINEFYFDDNQECKITLGSYKFAYYTIYFLSITYSKRCVNANQFLEVKDKVEKLLKAIDAKKVGSNLWEWIEPSNKEDEGKLVVGKSSKTYTLKFSCGCKFKILVQKYKNETLITILEKSLCNHHQDIIDDNIIYLAICNAYNSIQNKRRRSTLKLDESFGKFIHLKDICNIKFPCNEKSK